MSRSLRSLALLAVLAAVSMIWVPTDALGRFRGLANDPVFPRGAMSAAIAVVAIDDPSLRVVDDGWPWSRTTLAALVQRLDEGGAAVVVLDLLLTDPRPDDDRLAEAMRRAGNVVLAAAPVAVRAGGDAAPIVATDVLGPTSMLAAAAAGVGSSLALPDAADGVLRRSPLVLERADLRLLPSLAVVAEAVRHDVPPTPLLRRPSGVQLGTSRFPTDEQYRLVISWPEPLEGSTISAAEVLAGRTDRERLAGRVVYVGATAPSLGDRWSTPVDRTAGTPGVVTHAAAHHTVASRQFLVPASAGESVAWMVALATVLVLATRFLPLWVAAAVDVLALVLAVLGAYERSASGALVDVIDLAVIAVLAVPLAGALRYVEEVRIRRRVSALFARYVPEPVARELVRQGRVDVASEGQRLRLTVLFCDLRGFTPVAASLPPPDVNRLLTEFYEHVSGRVLRHGGTVVQYVGDEVFAVFGAPLPSDDHAARAVEAAVDVQREHGDLRVRLGSLGLPEVVYGVAVHTGEAVAVHAGSSVRRQYAIVGDVVNVGSRLCGTAQAGDVVVSEDARAAAALEGVGEAFEPHLRGVTRTLTAWRWRP